MKLTDEQNHALQLFKMGDSLKVSAFAGTGKTSTLVALSKSTSNRGLYLAFNKSIADEASKKFSPTVDCRTTHSIALRSLPEEYKNRGKDKLFSTAQAFKVAKELSLRPLVLPGDVLIKENSLAYLALETVKRFCHSGDGELGKQHIPLHGKINHLEHSAIEEFLTYITGLAAHLWGRMQTPDDLLPLGHDGYLKLWSLISPELPFDYIMLDEAQDTNEAVLSVLRNQINQTIYVGDKHQQIYAWRGAVNAMEKAQTSHEAKLTQSFRFGPKIAEVANTVLSRLKESQPLIGNASINSTINSSSAHPTAILCRTNAGVLGIVLDILASGKTPHVIGGTTEIVRLLEDVTRLKQNIPADSPEFYGFKSWTEVVLFTDTEEGEQLKTFVNIVAKFGEHQLINALKRSANIEAAADIIVSTGHKSKGREWDVVELNGDFHQPRKIARNKREEIALAAQYSESDRLLYVALTRGKTGLIIPSNLATSLNLPFGRQTFASFEDLPFSSKQKHSPSIGRPVPAMPKLPTGAKIIP